MRRSVNGQSGPLSSPLSQDRRIAVFGLGQGRQPKILDEATPLGQSGRNADCWVAKSPDFFQTSGKRPDFRITSGFQDSCRISDFLVT